MKFKNICGNQNLPLKNDKEWNSVEAYESIIKWAGGPDKLDFNKAKQGFLLFDEDKKTFSFPFVSVVGDKLVASASAFKTILSNQGSKEFQTGFSGPVLNEFYSFIDGYDKKTSDKSFNNDKSESTRIRFDSAADFKMLYDDGKASSNDAKKKVISLDMLRTGKFLRQSWFGDYLITITPEMMDLMIKNFDDGVVVRGVPLDTNHNHQESYGWLQKAYKENRDNVNGRPQTVLVGDWSVNPNAESLLKDEIYKFFSIEFDPNFKQHEVFDTTKTPDGREVAIGDVTCYGPTITGGALTNRPFIPNMNAAPMAFSEDKNNNIFNIIEFEENKFSGGSKEPVVNLPQPENRSFSFDIKKFTPSTETKKMEFSATESLIKFMQSNLDGMSDKSTKEFKELSLSLEKAKEEFSSAKKELSDKDNVLNIALDTQKKTEKVLNDLTVKVVSLENSNKENASELALQRERTRQETLKFHSISLASHGIPKPVIDTVKEILLHDVGDKEVVMFGEGDKKISLTLKGVLDKVLFAFPKNVVTVPLTEGLEFNIGDGNKEISPNGDEVSGTEEFLAKHKDAIEKGTKVATKGYTKSKKEPAVSSPAADKR